MARRFARKRIWARRSAWRLAPGPPAASAARSVSLVIPTFGRPRWLHRCLEAVAAQTAPASEVIVVCRSDDTATLEAIDDLRARWTFSLLTCDEPRLVAQMDLGAAAATGDVVAFTDDDAAPRPDWIARLLTLYGDARVGAVGGRDVIHDPQVDSSANGKAVGVVSWRGQPLDNHHREGVGVRRVDVLKGVNLSVRQGLWQIDRELLGIGNQTHWELGLCLRIRRLGWDVLYDPGLLVDHYAEPRVDEPQRALHDDWSLARDAHNELYELVRWLPWWQWPVAVANAFMVGSRAVPGVVAGGLLAAHGLPLRTAMAEVAAASRGRARALRARPRRSRG